MIESILTRVTAAETYDLTTVDRVKRELEITDGNSDAIIAEWIHEESETLAGEMGRVLASEVLSEEFRLTAGISTARSAPHLIFARRPVTEITSVTEDADAALDASLYQLDAAPGLLYRLDSSGCRISWCARKVVVVYTAGYALLTSLPRDIEAAVITMVRNRKFGAKRDPAVKLREITDVGRWDYWVGPIGDGYPPDVQRVIDRYRERSI